MNLKPYPKYKDSGVEWLGEVPEHWDAKRFKYIAQINPSKPSEILSDDSQCVFIPMEAMHDDGTFENTEIKPVAEVKSGYTYFAEDDIIFAKITPCFENGKGAWLHQLGSPVGFGSTEFHVLRSLQDKTIPKFLYYLTKSFEFRSLGAAYMQGVAGQKRVTNDFVENYLAGLPPIKEQILIGAFLQHETAKIDALIVKKQRQIALLQEKRTALISHAVTKGLDPNVKMKDSGVEWLGEVPEHWEVIRLKYVFWLQRGHDLPITELQTGAYPVCGSNGCIGYHDKFTTEGPGITVGRSGSVGEVNYINTNYWAHNTALYVKEFRRAVPKFTFYLLKTLDVKYLSEGTAVGTLNRNNIHDLYIAIPEIVEQQAIATHIDNETGKAEILIEKISNSVNKLQEYRTALISAAVTGKIDVRGEKVA